MGGHGKSIGNVIKSSELRSILLEKYLSAVRCILLMDGPYGFQRQDGIGDLGTLEEREGNNILIMRKNYVPIKHLFCILST
jgi:hypothetical protein